MTQSIKVADLKAGDILSSGAKVISAPVSLVRTPKGKVQIGIQYPNGNQKVQTWGKHTTVNIQK